MLDNKLLKYAITSRDVAEIKTRIHCWELMESVAMLWNVDGTLFK